jgi:hypothetical protein
MKKLPFFIFFVLVFFFSVLGAKQAIASQVDAPTIVEIGPKRGENFFDKFYVKGLTPANTEVLIYINGIYAGEADIADENTDADSFYYENLDIFSGDGCRVKLIAKDKTSLVLSAPVEIEYLFPVLPAPTLLAPKEDSILGNPKPVIIGLSATQSFVHIYIDGIYNGQTDLLLHDSGTANFNYRPFLNLKPGVHEIRVIAEDKKGRKSDFSEVLEIKIEEPMPAPNLLAPLFDGASPSQPLIVGLAKNDSFIKIYIDHKLIGSFLVANHNSGVANFFFGPIERLSRGEHFVYSTATDSRGKESQWSKIIYFFTRQPVIADAASEDASGQKKNKSEAEDGDSQIIISPSGDIQQIGIEDKYNGGEKSESQKITSAGSVNEEVERQGKLSPNLIVFVIFLLGIIGWILWVNRQLVQEQRQQGKKEKDRFNDNLFSEGEEDDSQIEKK